MTNHLVILPEYTYAGYCSLGANKDWAACLAIETENQNTDLPMIEEMTEVCYLSLHGPHGGNMLIDPPRKLAMTQARAHFTKKCREKENKAYKPVPFGPYLSAFGRPFGLDLILLQGEGQDERTQVPSTKTLEEEADPPLGYQAVAVKAMPREKIQQFLALGKHGVTEKVNGERCLVVFDGDDLRAYNRRGKRMSAPPTGAAHLCKLEYPFVIDGERLTGDQAGHFVAFDLLEWNKEVFTTFSYVVRITTLEEAMYQAGLLLARRSTPTFLDACLNSTVNDLSLLVAATGTERASRIIEEIQGFSGEGIVIRRLESPYDESPLKFKFTADIDAFVIGVNDGIAEGSLKFGILRSTDHAIIEVANVRSGFTDADIRVVREMLKKGERPVFTVTFLPIRTVGLQLVEPRTSMSLLRSDKDAAECTTSQFGAEKALLIAQAKPVEGIANL